MCKISVIVPMYNGESTIARCLDSLINQKLQDIEILVVNDGSKDNGESIVRDYMLKDSRIRLISQENQGLGAARNYGIRKARGKYVGFVDCDDFVDDNMYQVMLKALEDTGAPVAVCQEKNVYINDGEIQPINETVFDTKNIAVYMAEDVLKWQINYKYLSLNSACNKLLERRIFTEYHISFPEQYRHAEDIVASVGIFSKVDRVVVVPQSLYYYVHTKGSISYNYSIRHGEDIYLDWKEALTYICDSGKKVNTDNFSLGMYFTSLKQVYWANDKNEKKTERFKKLTEEWKKRREEQGWKPDFSEVDMPFMHKIKVIVAYFHLCRPVLAGMKRLTWIPLFKYLT